MTEITALSKLNADYLTEELDFIEKLSEDSKAIFVKAAVLTLMP